MISAAAALAVKHVRMQGGRRAEYKVLGPRRRRSLQLGRVLRLGRERREGEKQCEVEGDAVLIPRQGGGGPVYTPCLMWGLRFPDIDLLYAFLLDKY